MYVAYASDAEGTGFSLVQSDNLKWRAEIHLDMELENPTAEDFASRWVKYIGGDGTGVGDMKASVYDADGDGVADRAKRADAADSVAWGNIADRPDTFTPATHTHGMEALSDPVRQRTRTEANPTALCLDIPVTINSATQTGATLAIDFPRILETAGGGGR